VTVRPSRSGINRATAPGMVPIITCLSMSDYHKFKHPFTCILSGPSGSGKSSFCIWFLHNFDTLSTERDFDGGVIWCYSRRQLFLQLQYCRRTFFLTRVSRQTSITGAADRAS